MSLLRYLALACLCLGIMSCSGRSGGSAATKATEDAWLALLDRIPDTDATRTSTYIDDFSRLAASLNLTKPSGSAGREEARAYGRRLMSTPGGTVYVGPYHANGLYGGFVGETSFDLGAWDREIGFNFLDIHQVAIGGGSFESYFIQRGRFEPDEIRKAALSDAVYKIKGEEVSYGGARFYTWGDDHRSYPRFSTAFRQGGRGGRITVTSRYIGWAAGTELIHTMIDTKADRLPALGDLPDMRTIASGLVREGSYAALFSMQTVRLADQRVIELLEEEYGKESVERLRREAPLRRFQTFGLGVGRDSKGGFCVLVAVHQTAAAASENVARFENLAKHGTSFLRDRPWSSQITSVEARSEGRVLYAKVRTTNLRLLLDAYNNLDTLLLQE